MSNSRHMRRKLQGKSGPGLKESQRSKFKRQRAAWQFQWSLANMSTQVVDALQGGVFAPKDPPADVEELTDEQDPEV